MILVDVSVFLIVHIYYGLKVNRQEPKAPVDGADGELPHGPKRTYTDR